MFSGVLKEVTGIFNPRFLLNTFFPSLIFWGLLIIVIIAGRWNIYEVIKSWNQQDVTFKTIEIVILISWVTFFSSVISSYLTLIIRFYEGYWNFPFLENIGATWHKTALEQLENKIKDNPQDFSYEQIYLLYPPPTRKKEVMPTRLGNILKNSELYPMLRYKIDAVLIWPRLYQMFPERFIQTIAETKSALEFTLIISSLSVFFAFISGIYLLIVGASWWLFLICFWGGLLIAWLAYKGALSNAISYAHQIKTAFDLYRNELTKQMRLPLPKNEKDERENWEKICQFLYRGSPINLEYINDENSSISDQKQP